MFRQSWAALFLGNSLEQMTEEVKLVMSYGQENFRFLYSYDFHLIALLHFKNTFDTVLDSKLDSVVLQS